MQGVLQSLTANQCSNLTTVTFQLPASAPLRDLHLSGALALCHLACQQPSACRHILSFEAGQARCMNSVITLCISSLELAGLSGSAPALRALLRCRVHQFGQGGADMRAAAQPECERQWQPDPPGAELRCAGVTVGFAVPQACRPGGGKQLPSPAQCQFCLLQEPDRSGPIPFCTLGAILVHLHLSKTAPRS